MLIPFVITRSRFIGPILAILGNDKDAFRQDRTVQVDLGEDGGYNATVRVKITANDRVFETDWEGQDATRFPARIKAAATALRDFDARGSYIVAHDDGKLTIKRAK